MKIIGVTGGIGSGKTTLCRLVSEKYGIPVYYSDERAKELMAGRAELRGRLTELFGPEAYRDGVLNRALIASVVFRDGRMLEQLNEAVHGAVMRDFREWVSRQSAPYAICEAAILVESGWWREMDFVVLVEAPEAVRVERVMRRDGAAREQAESRIAAQATDAEKEPYADAVIVTGGRAPEELAEEMHRKILAFAAV